MQPQADGAATINHPHQHAQQSPAPAAAIAPSPKRLSPAEQIERVTAWLRLFIATGQVVELRALNCSTPSYRKHHTEAGFFDYDHLPEMAKEALRLTKIAQGVYWTINPVNPDLLSRRANRIDVADRGVLAQDSDIIRRSLFYVDADPVRPSGISSTPDEKSAAFSVCAAVRNSLHREGWPDPILADSGNGYHLLYRVDLPRDDGELIKRCLLALASRFNTDAVKVDTSVFNPSRICKLYGTIAKKGDNTPDRPHRRAVVMRADGDVRIVSRELLDALAVQAPGLPGRRSNGESSASGIPPKKKRKKKSQHSVEERARKYIARMDPAVSGNKGHDTTYRAAAILVDGFALEPDEALPILQEFNERCEPPWSDAELQHKLESALANVGDTRGHLLIDKKTAGILERVSHVATIEQNEFDLGNGIGNNSGYSGELHIPSADSSTAASASATAVTSTAVTPTAPATISPIQSPPDLISRKESARRLIQLCIGNDEGQTDRANGRRLAHRHGYAIRYCHPWRKWLIWDGMRWKRDDSGEIMRRAKDVADDLWADAAEYCKQQRIVGDEIKPIFAFAKSCAANTRLQAMVSLAASEPGIPIHPEYLDADHWLINCPNGTVDLRTAILRPHSQADNITKLCPTPYDPNATCPNFMAFLNTIFDGNQELIEFVQTLFGYCLTGSIREQVLPIFYGEGSNGKSTLITAIMETMGPDYTMQAVADLLMAKKTDGHPTDRADLFGMRMISCIETEDNKRLAESTVKQLTGGDRIRARRMREDFWEFSPTHKIILATNHMPRIKGTDHAIWRRLALVPFLMKFWDASRGESGPPEREISRDLPELIKREHSGILAWQVQGCLRWQKQGLRMPASVQAATTDYRDKEDLVGQFIADRCLTGPQHYSVKASAIYGAFRAWCETEGEYAPSQRVFGERLGSLGFERFRTASGKWWRGVMVRDVDGSVNETQAAGEQNEFDHIADAFETPPDGSF